jgi:hypothetical protein
VRTAVDRQRERWVSKIAWFMHLHLFTDLAYVTPIRFRFTL